MEINKSAVTCDPPVLSGGLCLVRANWQTFLSVMGNNCSKYARNISRPMYKNSVAWDVVTPDYHHEQYCWQPNQSRTDCTVCRHTTTPKIRAMRFYYKYSVFRRCGYNLWLQRVSSGTANSHKYQLYPQP